MLAWGFTECHIIMSKSRGRKCIRRERERDRERDRDRDRDRQTDGERARLSSSLVRSMSLHVLADGYAVPLAAAKMKFRQKSQLGILRSFPE